MQKSHNRFIVLLCYLLTSTAAFSVTPKPVDDLSDVFFVVDDAHTMANAAGYFKKTNSGSYTITIFYVSYFGQTGCQGDTLGTGASAHNSDGTSFTVNQNQTVGINSQSIYNRLAGVSVTASSVRSISVPPQSANSSMLFSAAEGGSPPAPDPVDSGSACFDATCSGSTCVSASGASNPLISSEQVTF